MALKKPRTTLKKSYTSAIKEYDSSKFMNFELQENTHFCLRIKISLRRKYLFIWIISSVRILQKKGGRNYVNSRNQMLV